jgi:hypothetical protein
MIDANEHAHLFVEKIPMVTTAYLDFASHLPRAGFIPCVVVGRKVRDDERPHVLIDTQTPWGVQSTTGRTQFEVLSEQLCELPNEAEGG